MDYFNNINLNHNELQKAVIHPLATEPATHKAGQMYFNTTDNKLYYYDSTKWVALNDVDLSNYVTTTQLNNELNNKLDKQTTTHPTIAQVYAVRGDTQQMINATSEAKENTVVLRDANGGLQVAAGVNDTNAVNKGQMDTAIDKAVKDVEHTSNKVGTITDPGDDTHYPNTKAVVEYVKGQVSKVKDVTLDGTSIVDTETGVVALESTYSTTLTGTSGTLTQEQYDNLNGDNASYIWYKDSDTDTTPMRLTKIYASTKTLSYQVVSNGILISATLVKTSLTWSVSKISLESTSNKVTIINNSSTDTQYPSAKAVYSYVTTELGKIDQFEYKVSTDAASTPEGIVWYSGTTESTKITGTLKASVTTEYTIYLVPCKHTAAEAQQGYDEYLTIKNSAGQYVWEVLGNTRDLDLSDYVSKTATGTQDIASNLRIKTGNQATTYKNGSISYTKDGNTEYNLILPEKGGTVAILDEVVTLSGTQTITGAKTFSEEVAFNNHIKANNSVGTAGQVLTSQGNGKAPQWTTLTIPQGMVKKFVNGFIGNNTDLEFSFEHKLGTDQCTVSLYKRNDSNNYEMVMADIILTTTNVIIKFAQAPTTTDSFRVVVTG